VWARVDVHVEQRAVTRFHDDLASGRWAERNRDLVDLDVAESLAFDCLSPEPAPAGYHFDDPGPARHS